MSNPRAHPTLAPLEDLPADILFVIPTIDILLDEQLEMVERLQREAASKRGSQSPTQHTRRIEKLTFEGQWHGWLECGSYIRIFESAHLELTLANI